MSLFALFTTFQSLQKELEERTSIQHLTSAEVELKPPIKNEASSVGESAAAPPSAVAVVAAVAGVDQPLAAEGPEVGSSLTRTDSSNSIEVYIWIDIDGYEFGCRTLKGLFY